MSHRQPTASISAETRLEGLYLILPMVRAAYPGQDVNLSNVCRLVDQVADALEKADLQSAVVYGTRLLSMGELDQLVGVLERAA